MLGAQVVSVVTYRHPADFEPATRSVTADRRPPTSRTHQRRRPLAAGRSRT